MSLRKILGLWRSHLMYYGKPFNRKRLRQFYAQFVPEGGLCFDLGAHLGNRSDAFLSLGAEVVAVEPQPVCIRYLERNLGPRPGFTLQPQAVGQEPGTAVLHVSTLTPTISTLAGRTFREAMQADTSFPVNWDQQVEVEVVTLDQLIDTYGVPDFCKIDVEDYEFEVLQGLSHPLPCLSFEYFSYLPQRARQCVDRLEYLDAYLYQVSYGETQRMALPEWVPAEDIRQFLARLDPEDRSGDIYARRMA